MNRIYAVGPNTYTITATATDDVNTYAAGNVLSVAVTHVSPVLVLSGAAVVSEGSAYTLDLSGTDPSHTISSWLIAWGDGTTTTVAGNPSSALHTYSKGPETCTITATATDDVGTYAASNGCTVTVNHAPPSLMISGPLTISEGSAYTLNLSGTDPGHTISAWSVNWGDGVTTTVNGNPGSTSHTYLVGPNLYNVTATATDDVGTYAASNSLGVAVLHVAPVAVLSGPSSVSEETPFNLGLLVTDPGHTIRGWLINWGDGSSTTLSGNPSSAAHTYSTGPVTDTITASVTDDAGTYAAANTLSVSVGHTAPNLTLSGASTVNEGAAYSLTLSASDGGHVLSSWLISWGDGTTSQLPGNATSTTHTYATGPNDYIIFATATDDVATYPAVNTLSVAVNHVHPTLNIAGPSSVTEGTPYVLSLSSIDAGHAVLGWLITWGDGATSTITG